MIAAITGSLSLLSSRQKLAVGLLALAALFINSLDIVAISLLGLVGAIALGQREIENLPWLDGLSQNTMVIGVLLVAAGVFAVKTVSGIFLTRTQQYFLASLEIYFSRIISLTTFSGDLNTVKKYSRSHLEWTILRSTSLAFGSVIGQSLSLFSEVSLTVFILVLFFYTDWVSALVVLVYFAVVLLIFQLLTKRTVAQTGSDFAEGSISVGQAISDTLVGFKEISVLSRIPFFLDRISKARARTARAQALQNYMQAVPRLVVELALIVGAIGFAAFQFAANAGNPELAIISIFVVGSLRLMSSLLPLYRSFMQLRYVQPQAFASQALLREAQSAPRTVRKSSENTDRGAGQPGYEMTGGLEVTCHDLTFHYLDRGEPESAVDRITLTIEPGSTVAFIGPSGAGKSTLVDLILGLHEPTSGRVLCSGLNPRALRDNYAGLMGYVPQQPGLIAGNLRDNIALGIPAEKVDEEALWEAVTLAQMDSFISGLPEGINSKLGEQTNRLSGGQVQRIGLARALYTRPQLLVLDEATSALDAETEASITESLSGLRGRTTTVVVAHRLSTVQHADTVFVIDRGRLVASGSLRDLEREVPLVKKYISLMSFDS